VESRKENFSLFS
jgi:hypothetical protein